MMEYFRICGIQNSTQIIRVSSTKKKKKVEYEVNNYLLLVVIKKSCSFIYFSKSVLLEYQFLFLIYPQKINILVII